MKPRKGEFLEKEIEVILSKKAIERHDLTVDRKLPGGGGIFRVNDFTIGVIYKTIGLTYFIFEDNSRSLVWLLYNDEGVLVERHIDHFVDIKERK